MENERAQAIRARLIAANQQVRDLHAQFRAELTGKKIRVVSKYNGQRVGRSRKPLTGRILTINNVAVDSGWPSHPAFGTEESGLYIGLDEIEFVEDV